MSSAKDDQRPQLTLPLSVDDPMGSGQMWHLFCVEFRVPDRAMEQSCYLYARSHKEAKQRAQALASGPITTRQLYGQSPA